MEMTLSRLSHILTGQTAERIHVILFCQRDHLSAYKLGHDIFPRSFTRFLFLLFLFIHDKDYQQNSYVKNLDIRLTTEVQLTALFTRLHMLNIKSNTC